MKRSQINALIAQAKDFFVSHHFILPPFAFWSPADWARAGRDADDIRACRLGWDVTDFGSGGFERIGLLQFTLRNGRPNDTSNPRRYAERVMIVRAGQTTPWHFHYAKAEDIINRGAGRLVVQVRNSDAAGGFADTPVRVSCDGIIRQVSAGGKVVLGPGESIAILPGLYHTYHAEPGSGPAMIGEVSTATDETSDSRFYLPATRNTPIVEDQPPIHLLCNEYPIAP
jgi:D-lyxose ketol-isomerase